MGANADFMLRCHMDGPAHHIGIGGMKSAGDIGEIHKGHHFMITPHHPGAKAFAHVCIQL